MFFLLNALILLTFHTKAEQNMSSLLFSIILSLSYSFFLAIFNDRKKKMFMAPSIANFSFCFWFSDFSVPRWWCCVLILLNKKNVLLCSHSICLPDLHRVLGWTQLFLLTYYNVVPNWGWNTETRNNMFSKINSWLFFYPHIPD